MDTTKCRFFNESVFFLHRYNNNGELIISPLNLEFICISGLFVSLIIFTTNKEYRNTNSEKKLNFTSLLPITTVTNFGIIVAGILLDCSLDSPYTIAILLGMGVGFIGDLNNVSINKSTISFIIGSFIFIVSYSIYSIGLLYSIRGFILLDIVVIPLILILYLLCLNSAEKMPGFQNFGKYKVITSFYPFALLFLLSRTFVNLFVGTIPLLNALIMSLGVVLIFITDMEYSMHKFFKPLDKLYGPILYPIGQLFIALSTLAIGF